MRLRQRRGDQDRSGIDMAATAKRKPHTKANRRKAKLKAKRRRQRARADG
jgi:hypothetical protein